MTSSSTAEPAALADRIVRDLPSHLAAGFGLYGLEAQAWLRPPTDDSVGQPVGFGDQGQVAVMFGSQRLVDAGRPSPDDGAQLVSFVQHCVIDELGFGWPEYYSSPDDQGGRFLGLLRPGMTDSGLCWLLADAAVALVGGLDSLPPGTVRLAG